MDILESLYNSSVQYYLVAPIIRAHIDGVFTYHAGELFPAGTIVTITVGKKASVGIVVGMTQKPSFTTKPITKRLYDTPLPKPLLFLASWLGRYYLSPHANVWQTILPRGLDKKRRATLTSPTVFDRDHSEKILTPAQKSALLEIERSSETTTLLQGVTGAGKTLVYHEIAKRTIASGRSVILLVPEIALTSQLVADFSAQFKNILLIHSKMTEAERHLAWQHALEATKPLVIIGPRSALFTPIVNLGLIVIDESHEPSYKQEQSPRYSTQRAARILASQHNAKLILGSATPSVSDRFLAESQKSLVRLDQTAQKIGNVTTTVIDSTKRHHFTQHRFLSNALLENIHQAIERGEQVLLFHNRRGSASTTLCENCGWSAECSRCFLPLTLHTDTFSLLCHVCGYTEKVPTQCPTCHHTNIIHKGIGTKLIFEELQRLYPNKKVIRFDKDIDKDASLEKMYQAVHDGEFDIIIGTQVIAKGLDLPLLSIVGIIQADSGLSLPDFAASERVFQLLYQVMGRVGRNEKESHIVIQTYQPTHPSISLAVERDYDTFYEQTLKQRHHDHFPPFTYLAKLTCSYSTEKSAAQAARKLKNALQLHASQDVIFLGPTPAFYERLRNQYRWQLVLRSPSRQSLVELLRHVPVAHWQVELDPVSLL